MLNPVETKTPTRNRRILALTTIAVLLALGLYGRFSGISGRATGGEAGGCGGENLAQAPSTGTQKMALTAAPKVKTQLWVPNDLVRAIVPYGDLIYLGGDFTYLGPVTGSGVVLDATSGKMDPAFPSIPAPVTAVAPDGAGGYYVGGDFLSVGGVTRHHLAHLGPDGQVDPAWDPDISDGDAGQETHVYAILLVGTTVYVGGQFSTVGGQPREALAAIASDPAQPDTYGKPTGWAPDPGLDETSPAGSRSFVRQLALLTDDNGRRHLYTAGNFTRVRIDTHPGGSFLARTNLVDWNPAMGNLDASWNPNPDGAITALAVDPSTNTLLVGGTFTVLCGTQYGHLARLTPASCDTQNFIAGVDGEVDAIAVYPAANLIFVGGSFTKVGESPHTALMVIDADPSHQGAGGTYMNALPWDPAPAGGSSGKPVIRDLKAAGTTLYVAGDFSQMAAAPRLNLGAFSLDSGSASLSEWKPGAGGPVLALCPGPHGIFAGGSFTSAGGVQRTALAALSALTGEPVPGFAPVVSGTIRDLALTPGGELLYLGGTFTSVGGQDRQNLAAVQTADGSVTPFDPRPDIGVTYLALNHANTVLYVKGSFSTIGGAARNVSAALRPDGTLLDWNPAHLDNTRFLVVSADDQFVYTGSNAAGDGLFNVFEANGAGAKMDRAQTGVPLHGPAPDAGVFTALVDGDAVYLGGEFHSMDGNASVQGVARFIKGTLDPTFNGLGRSPLSDAVRVIYKRGDTIFIGGHFNRAGDTPRNHFAALSAVDGTLLDWDLQVVDGPGPRPQNPLLVGLRGGSTVYVSHSFATALQASRPFFLGFE